eukprot:5121485-Amphidinium_carterae.1
MLGTAHGAHAERHVCKPRALAPSLRFVLARSPPLLLLYYVSSGSSDISRSSLGPFVRTLGRPLLELSWKVFWAPSCFQLGTSFR